MEDPTFHLDGVIHVKDDLEDFEGPLVLILQLLAKNKIEIQDVQISSLLDQYMAYLDKMKSMDLEIASEFVAMASHLVYIKARMLLSVGEESPELEELKESLENLRSRGIYDSIRGVIPALERQYTHSAGIMIKSPEPLAQSKEYGYIHDKSDLTKAMLRLWSREELARIASAAQSVPVPSRIVYSVTSKTKELLTRLRECGSEKLSDIFRDNSSRSELVATFIVLLELCRSGSIWLEDTENDVVVSYVAGEYG